MVAVQLAVVAHALDFATHVLHVILLSLCRHLQHCIAHCSNMLAHILFVWLVLDMQYVWYS